MLRERKIFDFHRKKRVAFSRGRIVRYELLLYRGISPIPKHLFHYHLHTCYSELVNS